MGHFYPLAWVMFLLQHLSRPSHCFAGIDLDDWLQVLIPIYHSLFQCLEAPAELLFEGIA